MGARARRSRERRPRARGPRDPATSSISPTTRLLPPGRRTAHEHRRGHLRRASPGRATRSRDLEQTIALGPRGRRAHGCRSDVRRHPPVRAVDAAAGHRQGALRHAHRPHAVVGPADADLGRAHARRASRTGARCCRSSTACSPTTRTCRRCPPPARSGPARRPATPPAGPCSSSSCRPRACRPVRRLGGVRVDGRGPDAHRRDRPLRRDPLGHAPVARSGAPSRPAPATGCRPRSRSALSPRWCSASSRSCRTSSTAARTCPPCSPGTCGRTSGAPPATAWRRSSSRTRRVTSGWSRDDTRDLIARLDPIAERLGCADELHDLEVILDRGASYERQLAVSAAERRQHEGGRRRPGRRAPRRPPAEFTSVGPPSLVE